MRVLIYSPVRLFGEGVAAFLTSADYVRAIKIELSVVGLESKVDDFGADIALIDITHPQALPAARLVKSLCPRVATIAMAVEERAEQVIACADAGFSSYVPVRASSLEMLSIMNGTLQGGTPCNARIARYLFEELSRRQRPSSGFADDQYLTPREMEIARMLSHGFSNKEIAAKLHLSVATVKNHVHSILRKLKAGRRTEVANLLIEHPNILSESWR